MGVRDRFLRTALHTISISLQTVSISSYLKTRGLNGSKELYANWALPLYPVSEDKSHMGQRKNRPKGKFHSRQIGL